MVFVLQEIGNKYGLTRQRISQIEIEALKKLKRQQKLLKILKEYHEN